MKWFLSLCGAIFMVVGIVCFGGKSEKLERDYIRIHIIANSNETQDQKLKYKVKDAVVEFLSTELAKVNDVVQAKTVVQEKMDSINQIVTKTLNQNSVFYGAKTEIKEEKMPTRAYDDLILRAGKYETLVITLGDGRGDNWWCVIFPNVCFAN